MKKRECNRHDDCDKAETEWLQRKNADSWYGIPAGFHCHDDCCEDCFGN